MLLNMLANARRRSASLPELFEPGVQSQRKNNKHETNTTANKNDHQANAGPNNKEAFRERPKNAPGVAAVSSRKRRISGFAARIPIGKHRRITKCGDWAGVRQEDEDEKDTSAGNSSTLDPEGFVGSDLEDDDKRCRGDCAEGVEQQRQQQLGINCDPPTVTACTKQAFRQRFQKLHKLGEGTYASVYAALDRTGQADDDVVAVKRAKFMQGDEGIPNSVVREFVALQRCQHENIVKIRQAFILDRDCGPVTDFVLVYEMAHSDLRAALDKMAAGDMLPPVNLIQKWSAQLLSGLTHMHAHGLAHRDLKPGNLLIFEGSIRIADLGMARPCHQAAGRYTHEIVTQWYRPPELLLGAAIQFDSEDRTSAFGYDPYAVDLWSVGCIMAEIASMEPLFMGRHEVDQLNKIMRLCGFPDSAIWPEFKALPYSQLVETYIVMMAGRARSASSTDLCRSLTRVFPTLPASGRDLISRLLALNPSRRMTASDALLHNFVANSNDAEHSSERGTNFESLKICHFKASLRRDVSDRENHRACIPELDMAKNHIRPIIPQVDIAPVPRMGRERSCVGHNFLTGQLGREISSTMRLMIVDWLIGVCDRIQAPNGTLHSAVAWFDRFVQSTFELANHRIARKKLQLAALACFWLACKVDFTEIVSAGDMIYFTNFAYTEKQLFAMEGRIMCYIGAELPQVCAHDYLRHLCESTSLDGEGEIAARCLLDYSLLNARHNTCSPRMLAAAAVCIGVEMRLSPDACVSFGGSRSASLRHTLAALSKSRATFRNLPNAQIDADSTMLFKSVLDLKQVVADALSNARVEFVAARWRATGVCTTIARYLDLDEQSEL